MKRRTGWIVIWLGVLAAPSVALANTPPFPPLLFHAAFSVGLLLGVLLLPFFLILDAVAAIVSALSGTP